MRSRRLSISSCSAWTDGGTQSLATWASEASASSISGSTAHAREDVLEREQGLEAGRFDEGAAVDRARVFDEVHGARRGVIETEPEKAPEDRACHRLRDRKGDTAGLADGHLDRHGAGPGDVEDAVRAGLQRERHRLGDVLLVDELHHRVEA